MANPTARAVRHVVAEKGWQPGTALENSVALVLSSFGFDPADFEQQYRIGAYRLDFAVPGVKAAIEADGWQHMRPETAARDAERDSWLRSQGWVVLRVDDRRGPDSLREQLVWPARIIRHEWDIEGKKWRRPRGRVTSSGPAVTPARRPAAAVEHPGGSSGGRAAGAPSPESTGAPAATSISARASSP